MIKNKKAPILLLITSICLLLAGLFIDDEYQFSISEQLANLKVSEALPVAIKKSGSDIIISRSSIDFLESNAVDLTIDFSASAMGVNSTGVARVKTGILYSHGSFYLTDFKLSDVTIDIKNKDRANDIKRASLNLANAAIKKIYKPKDDEEMDSIRENQIKILKPILISAIENKVKEIPIYSLNGKDLKHSLAAMALKDISFSSDQVTITLSVMMFLSSLAFFALSAIAALAMVFAIIRSGGGAMAIAAI